jgi:HEAT repeat protein
MIRAFLHHIRFLLPLGVVLVFAFDSYGQTLEPDPLKVMIEQVRAERPDLQGPFSSATAQHLAERYGTRYVPDLIARLESPDISLYEEGPICFTLGKIGDPRGRDAMIALLKRPFPKEEVSDSESSVIRSAAMGLAYIADEVAIAVLAEMVTVRYWAAREDIPSVRSMMPNRPDLTISPVKTREDFRKDIHVALSKSSSPKALEILQGLRNQETDINYKKRLDRFIRHQQATERSRTQENR